MSLILSLLSFSSGEILTMIWDESLVSNEGDATISVDKSVGGSDWALSLDSGSGSPIWGYVWLISGRGGSDKEGVIISLDISSSTASGSVVISSTNAGSSGVSWS